MAHVAPHQPSNDPAALSAMPDDRLMVLFRLGNSEAFSELFHRYSNSICGFFHRRIENPSRAEELAQEVFIVVLRKGERYEPRATFRTYLYSIAMRMVMAERRRSHQRESSSLAHLNLCSDCSVDAAIWVRRAIEQLEAEQREILLLREYEQLTYDEIALLLRLPVNTVRSRLFRARTALKALLLPLRPEMRDET